MHYRLYKLSQVEQTLPNCNLDYSPLYVKRISAVDLGAVSTHFIARTWIVTSFQWMIYLMSSVLFYGIISDMVQPLSADLTN